MIDKNVSLEHKKVLITGVAGFIGANLAVSLLRTVDSIQIIGIDNLNDYYDVSLIPVKANHIRGGKNVRNIYIHKRRYCGERNCVWFISAILSGYCCEFSGTGRSTL